MAETTDKFDVLLATLQAWAKQQQQEPRQTCPQLVLRPDGSGRLEDGWRNGRIEFADLDEVVTYMKRRITVKAPADSSDSIFETEEHPLDDMVTKAGTGD
jgi:hypothetical protein